MLFNGNPPSPYKPLLKQVKNKPLWYTNQQPLIMAFVDQHPVISGMFSEVMDTEESQRSGKVVLASRIAFNAGDQGRYAMLLSMRHPSEPLTLAFGYDPATDTDSTAFTRVAPDESEDFLAGMIDYIYHCRDDRPSC